MNEFDPERMKEILSEQGLGAHELPVPNGPDSTPTEPAATESKRTPDPAHDQPTPTEEELQEAGYGEPTREQLLAAFDAGYTGAEAPLGRERPPITAYEKALTLAWAKGVWQRQGEAEAKRRASSLAEMETRLGRKVPEQSPEARRARAETYQRQHYEDYLRQTEGQ